MGKKGAKKKQAFEEDDQDEKFDLNLEEMNKDEDGQDLGGLMATLAQRKGKKPKQKKKRNDSDEEDAAAILARLDAENEKQEPAPKKVG